jgi:hypothetical protein
VLSVPAALPFVLSAALLPHAASPKIIVVAKTAAKIFFFILLPYLSANLFNF